MATGINTRAGSRRQLEYAFEHAVVTGRKKVTIVHKANIMFDAASVRLQASGLRQKQTGALPGLSQTRQGHGACP